MVIFMDVKIIQLKTVGIQENLNSGNLVVIAFLYNNVS